MQAFKNLFRRSNRKKEKKRSARNDDQTGTIMEGTVIETETKPSKGRAESLKVAQSMKRKKALSPRSSTKHNLSTERTDTVIPEPPRDNRQEKTGVQDETKSMMPVLSTMTKASSQKSTKKMDAKTTMLPAASQKAFIESTLSRGIKGLTHDFRSRKRALDKHAMSEFYKQNPEGRNRYKDVGCLDNSRVILHLGPVPYIHANYVSTPSNPKKFICTQAPITKTIPEFWYMVVQEKSGVILMLCNMFERGANKCSQYFPAESGGSLTFEGISVTSKKQEQMNLQTTTSAKIIVSHLEVIIPGHPVHACSHYHWQDWPDRGVPEADMAPIQLLRSLNDNGAPIIVHCSAGIGRTGSIVLLQHVLELMSAGQDLDATLLNYLDELRKQRNNSIQQQYFYVHQVMLMHLRQNGCMEEKGYKEAMLKFTIEYQKATTAFAS